MWGATSMKSEMRNLKLETSTKQEARSQKSVRTFQQHISNFRIQISNLFHISNFPFRASVKQKGDTIIEVLIAMAVIGLVLGGAFGLSNRATQTGRAAQERTEALKLAENQLELTKAFLSDPATYNVDGFVGPFCIDETLSTGAGNAAIASPNALCEKGLYTVSIEETSANTYEVKVTWERINTTSGEDGELSLYYRVGAL